MSYESAKKRIQKELRFQRSSLRMQEQAKFPPPMQKVAMAVCEDRIQMLEWFLKLLEEKDA